MKSTADRLFDAIFTWTVFTTIFAWLPLVRIVSKPEGYTWGIMRFTGTGWDGPYGIWVFLTLYAFIMLCYGQRFPRKAYYLLLLAWHTSLTTAMVVSIASMGDAATLQGQGLRFEIPLFMFALPAILFTGLLIAWIAIDYRKQSAPLVGGWGPTNPRRLGAAIVLLLAAMTVFRLGTNYNWVTAVAIVMTIVQWILMVGAFKPGRPVPPQACTLLLE